MKKRNVLLCGLVMSGTIIAFLFLMNSYGRMDVYYTVNTDGSRATKRWTYVKRGGKTRHGTAMA